MMNVIIRVNIKPQEQNEDEKLSVRTIIYSKHDCCQHSLRGRHVCLLATVIRDFLGFEQPTRVAELRPPSAPSCTLIPPTSTYFDWSMHINTHTPLGTWRCYRTSVTGLICSHASRLCTHGSTNNNIEMRKSPSSGTYGSTNHRIQIHNSMS